MSVLYALYRLVELCFERWGHYLSNRSWEISKRLALKAQRSFLRYKNLILGEFQSQ